VRALSKLGRQLGRRWLAGVAAALTTASLSGCADFWDKVTSHDFEFKSLWTSDPPLVVLRDSEDGDKRAKAMRALEEPLTHGGTQQDQEFVLQILGTAAVKDRQPLCRLAAISSLGKFKDPRAVQYLKDAFYNASNFPDSAVAKDNTKTTPGAVPGPLSIYSTAGISLDMPNQIECQALVALGQTGNPLALDLLTRVVREPRGVGADEDRQQGMDVRLAAARALGNFHDARAADALVGVFKQEKDVALRDRLYESLEASTGKKLPPDPQKWDELVHGTPTTPPGTMPPALATGTPKTGISLTGGTAP